MKKNYGRKWILIITIFLCNLTTIAQINPDSLREFLSHYDPPGNIAVSCLSMTKDYYEHLKFTTSWIQKESKNNCIVLLTQMQSSADMGLKPGDYPVKFIDSFRNGAIPLRNLPDSLDAEVSITIAAIHFYSDLAYGNVKPSFGYTGLNYIPGCYNIPVLLADYGSKNMLQLLPFRLSSSLPEITVMENKLRWFATVAAGNDFKQITIVSNKVSGTNQPLVTKLYQLGIVDTADFTIPDTSLKQKVKEAQKQFGLLADGLVRSTTIQQLNIPLSVRVQQLSLALNYYRWLSCLVQDQSVITVNIPAAYMKVYRQNSVILEMRMVVGKQSSPTPALTSKVNDVTLYPYWHVPNAIATKELLPKIKRNAAFINDGNYQVLNKAGKIMDPNSVNWRALSMNNFPYIIRQSTGCDNALGLLKLNFFNPFDVYLHDTPSKNAFGLNKRFFSHGCMRMEKPMDLGRLVLKNNTIAIDTLTQKGCLRNQAPIVVPAREKMPVIVWYNPAGVDSTGRILFYEDIYKKFSWMKKN